MTRKSKFDAALHVELWKQAVQVQQHFNDIGWRIRAIALTALTFTFGATGLTYVNTAPIKLGGFEFSAAAIVPILGLILWWAFWFMDAKWFHRLLVGSVIDGTRLEKLLAEHGIEAELGSAIGHASATKVWPWKKPMRSTERLDLFYRVITGALLLTTAGVLMLGAPKQIDPVPVVDPIVNNFVIVVPRNPAVAITPTPAP